MTSQPLIDIKRATRPRTGIAGVAVLTALTCGLGAGAARAADPSNADLSAQILTLKQQAASLQAENDGILKTIAELKQTLQAKAAPSAPGAQGIGGPGSPAPPPPVYIPTAPSGPPDLKAAAAALHAPDALNLDGMPAEGDKNARVAILEYTDFEDDDSGDYARGAFAEIEKHYIATGKVRYIHQDFTQPWDANAIVAAQAARCSGDQGKYWEMRRSLFGNQDALGEEAAIDRAETLGENVDDFKQCLRSGRFAADVTNSNALGQHFGVTIVPTLFIGSYDPATNSMQIRKTEVGSQSYATLKADIDAQLAAAHK